MFHNQGTCGPLEVIFRSIYDAQAGSYAVVRWCSRCGATVVDEEVDNRNKPGGIVSMKFAAFRRNKVLEAVEKLIKDGKGDYLDPSAVLSVINNVK